MASRSSRSVYGVDGLLGTLESDPSAFSDADGRVVVRVDEQLSLTLPVGALTSRDGGGYSTPLGREEVERLRAATGTPIGQPSVIPVVAEQLQVSKRAVETGRVRIRKSVDDREEVIDEPLLRDEVRVERVPVDRFVEAAPGVREEGETLVIPVVEEVLVVEKRLRLREEIRVTRRTVEERRPQKVVVRRERVDVERVDPEPGRRGRSTEVR